jgi:hypothetical protein
MVARQDYRPDQYARSGVWTPPQNRRVQHNQGCDALDEAERERRDVPDRAYRRCRLQLTPRRWLILPILDKTISVNVPFLKNSSGR